MAEPTPAEIEAVKVLIAHQRRDIGSCLCGWGVDTGDLGRLHSLHVWRVLQAEVLPLHFDAYETAARSILAVLADCQRIERNSTADEGTHGPDCWLAHNACWAARIRATLTGEGDHPQ